MDDTERWLLQRLTDGLGANMAQTLIIEGQLPGLNDMLDARGTRYRRSGAKQHTIYSTWKKAVEQGIAFAVMEQKIRPVKFDKTPVPIVPTIRFFEPDMRRDVDNIMAGQKFIWDALVTAGILPRDSRKYLANVRVEVAVDKIRPRIEVDL